MHRILTETSSWKKTLYISFVAQLVVAVGFSTIFPFLPLYVQDLGSNTSLSVEMLAGLVFSSQAFTMMIASPIWGAIADRYGRKLMVQRAMFGGAIIILLMGFARSAEELILLRAIQGFITGTVGAINAMVAAVAPRAKIGFAMGLIQVGLWAGIAVGPLLGGVLADAFGYRMAFVVTAVLLLGAGILVWLGIDEQFVPSNTGQTQPLSFLSQWRYILIAPGVSLTYLLQFLTGLARVMLIPILPLFIQLLVTDPNRTNTAAGLVISVAAATGTFTSIYLGRIGDRVGHRRILIGSAFLAGLFYIPQGLVTQIWQLVTLQALSGAAIGGIIPTIGALLANYTQPGEEGKVYGLNNSLRAGSRAVAPLVGAGVAFWFGTGATFVVTGAMLLIVALIAVFWLPAYIQQT